MFWTLYDDWKISARIAPVGKTDLTGTKSGAVMVIKGLLGLIETVFMIPLKYKKLEAFMVHKNCLLVLLFLQ